eukprot:921524-Prymnesium_polylepis.1
MIATKHVQPTAHHQPPSVRARGWRAISAATMPSTNSASLLPWSREGGAMGVVLPRRRELVQIERCRARDALAVGHACMSDIQGDCGRDSDCRADNESDGEAPGTTRSEIRLILRSLDTAAAVDTQLRFDESGMEERVEEPRQREGAKRPAGRVEVGLRLIEPCCWIPRIQQQQRQHIVGRREHTALRCGTTSDASSTPLLFCAACLQPALSDANGGCQVVREQDAAKAPGEEGPDIGPASVRRAPICRLRDVAAQHNVKGDRHVPARQHRREGTARLGDEVTEDDPHGCECALPGATSRSAKPLRLRSIVPGAYRAGDLRKQRLVLSLRHEWRGFACLGGARGSTAATGHLAGCHGRRYRDLFWWRCWNEQLDDCGGQVERERYDKAHKTDARRLVESGGGQLVGFDARLPEARGGGAHEDKGEQARTYVEHLDIAVVLPVESLAEFETLQQLRQDRCGPQDLGGRSESAWHGAKHRVHAQRRHCRESAVSRRTYDHINCQPFGRGFALVNAREQAGVIVPRAAGAAAIEVDQAGGVRVGAHTPYLSRVGHIESHACGQARCGARCGEGIPNRAHVNVNIKLGVCWDAREHRRVGDLDERRCIDLVPPPRIVVEATL